MKILLTGISTRALAESALKTFSYAEILTLDYFGDYDQQRQCENYSLKRTFQRVFTPQGLLKASQILHFDSVIYTANLENYPSVVRKFQDRSLLLGNSPETLSRVRSPEIFFPFLEDAGIPYPKTFYGPVPKLRGRGSQPVPGQVEGMEAPDPLPSSSKIRPSRATFLQKPVLSGGGFHISPTTPTSRPVAGKKGRWIIQEYIEGLPCSALFLANGQESVLIGLTEQLIGRKEFGSSAFRYCGNILGKIWKEGTGGEFINRLAEITNALTREFHLKGVNGMDFILKDGIPYLLEVNPRYTAAMELVERAYPLNVVEAHIKSFEGSLPLFNLLDHVEKGYWGKAILFAEKNLKIPLLQKDWFERGIRDIPFKGERISRGNPICTLFAYGTSKEVCYQELVNKAGVLKAELG